MADLQSVKTTLAKHGQSHLLRFYDQLSVERQAALLEQLAAIDLDELDRLVDRYVRVRPQVHLAGDILPPETINLRGDDRQTAELRRSADKRGRQLIADGKVAAFVVAGGQGTRLGFEGPKGCFEATVVAHKPLFQVFAEQILAAARRAGVAIPWYVMTSEANDVVTRAYFRRHDFFGLDSKDVFFLVQGSMPAIDMDGKLMLANKGRVASSPNGHGGSLLALRDSGALEDMRNRGIELISYFQVDNPLVRCIDPVFLGLGDLRGAEMSVKVLPKRDPMEKLGNVCVVDGKVTVIEYSDMPESLARECTTDGRLRFNAGSIAIHVLSRRFVERLTADGRCELPFHRADKVVTHIDQSGEPVTPAEPNAVKLEMFIFDALPLAEKTVILQTDRGEEFSPIKNATGPDSLATSLHDQVRRSAVWLERAGIMVPRDADGQVAAAIEISPLYADSADELAKKVDKNLKISAGQSVYLGSRGQTGGLR